MLLGHSGVPKEKINEILSVSGGRIYFIGIGGVSMSSIARLLLGWGLSVFGSDISKSSITEELERCGAKISYGHKSEAVKSAAPILAVYSLSIDSCNEEYRYSVENGILTVSRAELLGAIIERYNISIGVSGSHGKSTTTAILDLIFETAGMKPTTLAGASLTTKKNFRQGGNDILIYESCEYRDSFLNFQPTLGIFLNLELDHTDYFKSENQIRESFCKAASLCKRYAIISSDDKNLADIKKSELVKAKVIDLGKDCGCAALKLFKKDLGIYDFSISLYGKEYGFSMSIAGEHNAYDAAFAAVAALLCGVEYEVCKSAISSFFGIERRLEKIFSINGRPVFYDYAHHPTEISKSKKALDEMGYKSVGVIFRPHTYSRTKSFMKDFATALSEFSFAAIKEVYAARESYMLCADESALVEAIRGEGGASFVYSEGTILDFLRGESFDALVIMGAGELSDIVALLKSAKG